MTEAQKQYIMLFSRCPWAKGALFLETARFAGLIAYAELLPQEKVLAHAVYNVITRAQVRASHSLAQKRADQARGGA
jgi:hypothetical protein